ncbi:MAG: hypothetical protein JNL97_04065 [Verrucomicrobiales bacterium]|nr:hypothetical protein [Verrucomicrobiales bacterium]
MSFFRIPFALLFASCVLARATHADSNTPESPSCIVRSPMDYQVFQRNPAQDALLPIVGSLREAANRPMQVRTRWVGAGPSLENWNDLVVLTAGQTDFRSAIRVPAGGWYRLEVRVQPVEAGAPVLAEAHVDHVGVGEVFVVCGQSNSANHAEERLESRTGRVAAFAGTSWQPCRDPQPGASGNGGSFMPPFGDLLAERFGVPIGIVAAGVGATSVREWLPRGSRFPNPPTLLGNVVSLPNGEWESKGTLFDAFVRRLSALGPRGFRAVLWHQGESDANQKDPTRTYPGDRYRASMELLIRETSTALGWKPPWFVARASYHTPDDPGSDDLRDAQKALWDSGIALEGPDTDALRGEYRDGGGKGVHFSGKGSREHARLWAEKVGPWLESQAKVLAR